MKDFDNLKLTFEIKLTQETSALNIEELPMRSEPVYHHPHTSFC